MISFGLGLAVVIALSLFSDISEVGASLETFNWAMLPAILGFTVLNYVLRWMKWDYYLRKLRQGDGVMLVTDGGRLIRLPADQVRVTGRQAMGVMLLRLDAGERVTSCFPVVEAAGEDSDA